MRAPRDAALVMSALDSLKIRFADPRVRAEIIAASWEIFSSLLFVSAVVPAAWTTIWPALIFLGSLAFSAALAKPLLARGVRGFALAGVIRMVSWPLATVPL